ncbi:Cell differentiation protein RCD1-like protein, partial [Dichanthelium oligosanthes]
MMLEEQLVLNLCDPDFRGNALVMFSKERKMFKAPLLWYYSFVTIAALFQEIVLVYPAISSPTLSASEANRACNALALLQTVAAHPKTRTPFLEAGIPLYLFLFLNATSKAKSFEYLRVRSLGVPSSLAKDDPAARQLQQLLDNPAGPGVGAPHLGSAGIPLYLLPFLNTTSEAKSFEYLRVTSLGVLGALAKVASVLANMVVALTEQPSTRLLKHVICCYLRLEDDPRTTLLEGNSSNNCWTIWLVLPVEHLMQTQVVRQVERLIQVQVLRQAEAMEDPL